MPSGVMGRTVALPIVDLIEQGSHATRPTEALKHSMKPTPWVLLQRRFNRHQLLRFVLVNLRMLTMMRRSHG